MPVAVGMYLPLTLAVPIFLGGIICHFASGTRAGNASGPAPEASEAANAGILVNCGLIAGESIMGVLLAVNARSRLD